MMLDLNNFDVNVDETTDEMGANWQQRQQNGNKNDSIIDLKSDGYEIVDIVDIVATKNEGEEKVAPANNANDDKYHFFEKRLIPTNEAELMNVPYRSYPNYYSILYYSDKKGTETVSIRESDYILGMCSVSKVNYSADDIELSPFVVAAFVSSELGTNYGLLIKFTDKSSEQRLVYLSLADIDANKHIRILLQRGFHISADPDVRNKFKSFLQRWKLKVDYMIPFVNELGYSAKYHGYFMADALYLKDTKKYIWFDATNDSYLKQVTPAGSYEKWKENIGSVAVKYPLPAFSLIYALSAPLLQLIDLSTMFVHFYGNSSRGKTLLLQLATSTHANAIDPNVGGNSYIQNWNTTNAGLENMARLFNGSIGVFDELHMCDDKQFAQSIYTICSGSSKTKATGNGNAQKKHDWKFLALSSGEQSGFEKLSKSNITFATLGRASRFVDVLVKNQIFTDFDGNELESIESEKLATKLKEECGLNFGHAGRDFVQQLLNLADSQEQLKKLIEQEMSIMFDKLTAGLTLKNQERRVMRNFAMIAVAGNFAVMFDILPMTEEQVFATVSHVRDIWLKEMEHFHSQKAKSEDYTVMLKRWLAKNINKFSALTDPEPKNNCKGYYQLLARGVKSNLYLLTSDSFYEVFGDSKISDVSTELVSKNILIPLLDDDGNLKRYQKSYRVSSIAGTDGYPAPVRLYTIDMGILNSYHDNDDDHGIDDYDADDDARHHSTMSDVSQQQIMDMMKKMFTEMSK